tara:strand:- start:134 stop:655 length:522 start_codon:yes stop_codon:yes gene_type:complete
MKKIKIIILTIFLVFSINTSNATEVYFINMTKILNESTAGKKAQEFLKKKFVSQSKEFEKESKTLKKEESELIAKKKVLSPEEYKKSINKLREKNIAFQKKRQKSSSDFLKQKNEARGRMLVAINPILQKYMDENNIDVVVEKKYIVTAKSSKDITDKVLAILNKELKSLNLK